MRHFGTRVPKHTHTQLRITCLRTSVWIPTGTIKHLFDHLSTHSVDTFAFFFFLIFFSLHLSVLEVIYFAPIDALRFTPK